MPSGGAASHSKRNHIEKRFNLLGFPALYPPPAPQSDLSLLQYPFSVPHPNPSAELLQHFPPVLLSQTPLLPTPHMPLLPP